MNRWYESPLVDEGIIISARIRFARNFEKYPFPMKLSDEGAKEMVKNAAGAVLMSNDKDFKGEMRYYDITETPKDNLLPLMERHVISSHLAARGGVKGIVVNNSEDVSVMLNEEDHVRIQSIFPGDNLDEALKSANLLDMAVEENGDASYAFHQEYGYLTSCPTNAGTGMRASLMLHLPALEHTGSISKILPALSKFRMTVRGIHGEGSESLGSIFQISNQFSLGKTEEEIIDALKTSVRWVMAQEKGARDKAITEHRLIAEDKLHRSYGILTNCRRIDHMECMKLLSDVRLGFEMGIFKAERPKKTIYSLMTNIQPGGLMSMAGKTLNQDERDEFRAEYIRKALRNEQ